MNDMTTGTATDTTTGTATDTTTGTATGITTAAAASISAGIPDKVTEQEYLYWLFQIPNIGIVSMRRLWQEYGSFEAVYNIEGKELKLKKLLHEKSAECFDTWKGKLAETTEEYCSLPQRGIRFVSVLDEEYPRRLKYLTDAPMGLYVKGELPGEEAPSVAIIGARNCSNYGKQVAEYMGSALSRNGILVISGLAAGIDGAGHRGALRESNPTFGVLGCGVNICYPKENYCLYEAMVSCGGILSEYKLGEAPSPGNFPMRNRIISGLSDVILVVEAREKSGSLITVEYALEQGKEVFAIPGPISSSLSKGCNRLIKAGAGMVTSPDDILDFFQLKNDKKLRVHEKNEKSLAKNEKMLYSCLDLTPKYIEQIMAECGLPIGVCMSILLELELGGYVTQPASHYYARTI